jgi:hypothetical protein
MFDALTDALRKALTRRLDPGLAADLALALESLEEHVQRQEEEHPAPVEPPAKLTDLDHVQQALIAAGIEPPAMHFGARVRAEAPPATPAPPKPGSPPTATPGLGRVVAGLSARLTDDGLVRVQGKDAPGRAVARTVETILATVMNRRLGEISNALLDLAVSVELLEKENAELRARLAALS